MSFIGPIDNYEFWIPLTARGLVNNDGDTRVNIVVRLRPDIAPRQAEAALLPYAQQATAHLPEESRAMSVALHSSATRFGVTFIDLLSGRGAPGAPGLLLPIFVTFALVLMICFANVANMMLARGLARQREIGVRLSLGASRGRVTRQLLTEGLLIAVLAGLAGVAIARAALGILLAVAASKRLASGLAGINWFDGFPRGREHSGEKGARPAQGFASSITSRCILRAAHRHTSRLKTQERRSRRPVLTRHKAPIWRPTLAMRLSVIWRPLE